MTCLKAVTALGGGSGTLNTGQIIGTGGTPTIAAGIAAGTGATATITGTNLAGVINVTTGTSTTANATLATITFNGILNTAPQGVNLMARNVNSAGEAAMVITTAPSTTTWTIGVGGAAFAASATFQWSYICI